MEDDRSGAQARSPRRSGSGSAPPAIASSIATSTAIRSTCRRRRRRATTVIRELEALVPAGVAEAGAAPDGSVRPRFSRRARSGSRRRSCRARCSRISPRAITRRSAGSWRRGRPRSPAPISIPKRRASGWRSCWPGSRSCCRAAGADRAHRVAGRAARAAVARAPGRQHDGRRRPCAAEPRRSRWRAAEQEVRSAQAQWTRLGPVPAEVAGPLNERFQRACRKFYDQRRRAS